MKRGFTLIELMAVVIILAVIGLIAVPTVNKLIKDNKSKLYQAQISSIDDAAKVWSDKHVNLLPEQNEEAISIPLILLKQEGLLPLDFKNPITDEKFYDNMYIDIFFEKNSYTYDVIEDSGNDYFSIDSAPIILKDTYNYSDTCSVNKIIVVEAGTYQEEDVNISSADETCTITYNGFTVIRKKSV